MPGEPTINVNAGNVIGSSFFTRPKHTTHVYQFELVMWANRTNK